MNEKETVLLDTLKPGDKFEWSGTRFVVRGTDDRLHSWQVSCALLGGCGPRVTLHTSFRVTKLEPKKPTTVTLEELEPGDTFTWVGASWSVDYCLASAGDAWVAVTATKDSRFSQQLWGETEVVVMR
jgi:hypothetical protein